MYIASIILLIILCGIDVKNDKIIYVMTYDTSCLMMIMKGHDHDDDDDTSFTEIIISNCITGTAILFFN